MDSATLACLYKSQNYQLTMVGFNYGQRHKKELGYMQAMGGRLNADVEIIDLTQITKLISTSSLTSESIDVPDGHYAEETMKATVVPNRNAIMLSLATGVAVARDIDVVATGVHAGDHFIYPDCRPSFFDPFAIAMREGNTGFGNKNLKLEAPFINKSKADICRLGHDLSVDWTNTWSCYKGGDRHCGRCGTCVERIEAFLLAGVPDPTNYDDKAFAIQQLKAIS
jgi:7-cyano-7-deazaguanine synthase